MKKGLFVSLLSLCLMVGLLPTAAMAANDEPDVEASAVCAKLEGCIDDAHDEICPLYVAPPEPDEEDDVTDLQEQIDALPDADALAEMDTEAQTEVYEKICDIYDAIDELTGTTLVYVNNDSVVTNYLIYDFAGTFDGDNHTISNLSFVDENAASTRSSGLRVGLFHTITTDGKVANLTQDRVTATPAAMDRLGSLAYILDGDAENCHVKNVNVSGSTDNAEKMQIK